MPTVIDRETQRRRWLGALALLAAAPSVRALTPATGAGGEAAISTARQASETSRPAPAGQPGQAVVMAAAWRADDGERIGLVGAHPDGWRILRQLTVPTRAHGLLVEGPDRYLAVARRPGDWVLRWDGQGRELAWAWTDPGRAFNGHVIASPDGRWLYTTETDLDTGAGLIGVRERESLEKVDEWSTGGLDPHELLLDSAGRLMVANGGIPTLPETGRLKIGLERMDASLVRLSCDTGEITGQWKLDDRRLSLRHVAWCGDQLGIALQAEHAEPDRRAAAPVLARFDGRALAVCEADPSARFAGYGGDVAATIDGWAVSCPRVGRIALWRADGRWDGTLALDEACALAGGEGRLWIGGRHQVLTRQHDGRVAASDLPALRLDNHWVLAV